MRGDPPRVVAMWLDGWGMMGPIMLAGTIPPTLGRLFWLEYLTLIDHWLTGPIPPELGQLAHLRVLTLAGNRLTGPIPPEMGQLARLERLRLSHNRLTGPIPPEMGAAGPVGESGTFRQCVDGVPAGGLGKAASSESSLGLPRPAFLS